jgi:prepilin-type N-terminal cleavage/methylation domain-containing protein
MSKKQGFTIAELMIASAILVMLLAAFLTTFNGILTMANYSEGLSLAYAACLSKLEEIVSHDFDAIISDYGPGTPGRSFDLTGLPSTFQAKGNTTVIDQPNLYGGGENLATANGPFLASNTSLVYDNKMWAIGGFSGVLYSTNGIIWTTVLPSPPGLNTRWDHTSLVYDNKMWVLGGFVPSGPINDVWYSKDGVEWWTATSAAQWTVRWKHTSLVYDNKMWVIGGCGGIMGCAPKNDVWYSNDGVTWTNATWTAFSTGGRGYHTSLVYDNRMWVIGGGNTNEVWNSTDGANWTKVNTASPMWSGRDCHTSLVYDMKMWVIGGTNGGSEVWYSNNGINWTQATANANWSARSNHTSLVYNNKMWLIGGYKGAAAQKDIWYSTGYNRLLEVVITVCWKQPNGRIFGEDANLNGILDVGEDKSNPPNGRLDSPAQLRIILSKKSMSNLRKVFLGRP